MKNQKVVSKVSTPGGVLTALKNKLCLELAINTNKLKILINSYTLKAFNGQQTVKMQFDKMNTFNELTKEDMSIKVFFKFLKLLDPKTVKITIEIETKNDQHVSVTETIRYFNSNGEVNKEDKP